MRPNTLLKTALFTGLGLVLLTKASTPAFAQVQLQPFKDKLFSYPATLVSERKGAYLSVAYNRDRDIMKRDTIPRRKAQQKYVNERVRWSRSLRRYTSTNGTFKHYAVGEESGARVTVIYVHGRGGNHRQGVNDWTFGGNFNRLQNLMVRNNGALLTPDFSDFKNKGKTDIAALVSQARRAAPSAKIIVACGSMGGGICWRLANASDTAQLLDGLFILGSHWDDAFLASPTIKKSTPNIPIVFGHGTQDTVYKPETQKRFFQSILGKNRSYPARFVMFLNGVHGTPIRMIDWRQEINWILAQ